MITDNNKNKTTLRKLISEIDLNKNFNILHDYDDFCNIFNLNSYDIVDYENNRLKYYYIKRWYCTDSFVGLRAYFLDNELVALSSQTGRKMNEEIEFISNESAEKVKSFIMSLMVEEKPNYPLIDERELDIEIDDKYSVEYNSQILQDYGYLDGEKVQISKRYFRDVDMQKDSFKYFHAVEIITSSGEKKIVDCRNIKLDYNS